jgi:hypothetical protein
LSEASETQLCVLGLQGGDRHRAHDVLHAAAARQIVDRPGDALGDRPVGLGFCQALRELGDVARLQIRKNQHVGFARHGAARRFHLGNAGDQGGVHLELTGEDVTECLGGARELTEGDLTRAYRSAVDPRLNYEQALEVAMLIVRQQGRLAPPASI